MKKHIPIKEMKSYFILIFISLFFVTLLSAQATQTSFIKTYKQGDCINIIQQCANCTFSNITSISIQNSTILLGNTPMVVNGVEYSYNFCDTLALGYYYINGVEDDGGILTTWDKTINITPNGQDATTANAAFYYGMIFLFVIVLLGGIYLSWKVKTPWIKILYACISYLCFVVITFIIWQVCANFISAVSFIPSITFMIWVVSTICFLPFIVIIILYMLNLAQKDLDTERDINMGYSEEEASKRRKR